MAISCGRICALITFGILSIIIGFIMTMVGNLATPFFDENDKWCDFCVDNARRDRINYANCRIAGPVFLGLGILLIFIGICLRQKSLKEHVKQGTNATSSTGARVVTYSSTGNTQQTVGPMHTTHPIQQQYPQFAQQQQPYPQYPTPPQQQYPPPPQQQYPPPPQQQYPAPLQHASQPQEYPPQYLQPGTGQPYSEKSGIPGSSAGLPPPPSYEEASAPPLD